MLGYIADFWCPSLLLVVEVDGPLHDREYDCLRDHRLARAGIRTLRLSHDLVMNNLEEAIMRIRRAISQQQFSLFDDPTEKAPRARKTRALFGARQESEVSAMVASGDWTGATAMHFAALYVLGHLRTYGVRPILSTAEYRRCAILAGNILGRDNRTGVFGGDVVAMAKFCLWSWRREKERHEWRQRNGREPSRLRPEWLFSHRSVDDWRVATEDGRRAG